MKTKILCSTGTIVGKANGFDYRLILKYRNEIEADGFELMMLKAFYGNLPLIASELNAGGVSIDAIHFEKDITALLGLGDADDREEGLRLFTENAEMGYMVGAKKAVFHLWDGRFSPERVEMAVSLLDVLYEICEKRGISLLVENVPCKTSPYETIRRMAQTYPCAKFTFDTRHASFRGESDLFLESPLWRSQIGHIHVSDYSGETVAHMWGVTRPILHPGEGIIDFDAFFDRMPPYAGDTLTLESPVMRSDGTHDIEKLNRTLRFLHEKMKKY